MKKVLALVLAVAMMATVAFAVSPEPGTIAPGKKITLGASDFTGDNGDRDTIETDWVDFDEDNFVISTKKITKGANLIESISFNDDDELVIKLKEDYTLTSSKTNLTISELSVKAKKSVKDDNEEYVIKKNDEFTCTVDLKYIVGWEKTVCTVADEGIEIGLEDGDAFYYVFEKGAENPDETANGEDASYMTTEIDFGGEGYAEGRVYDGDEVFYSFNMDADTDILKAYPDAELRFFEIEGNGFPTTLSFELYAAEDEYVYAVKDGKLTNSGLKWDEDVYAWTGKVRSAVQYVISDIELDTAAVEPETPTTENPETGANDVVGVATALAVVSLVAAGAVSLKK